ncbi:hypothetical protein E4K10_02420 [Streptomyces sp. T1317-0309]|nr:hypothetical protein E4K10_02420 [Streptomyces sp. T1317-0309]
MINQPLEARIRVRDEIVADPRVVAAVVEAVNTQVPVYAALDDSRLPEVRAIAAWGVDRLLDLWASDGTLGPADLRRFRGIAAARAATAGRCRRCCVPIEWRRPSSPTRSPPVRTTSRRRTACPSPGCC